MSWIDSHCHLNFPEYTPDLDDVLNRARSIDVNAFITVNTQLSEARELHALCDRYNDVFCTVGNHPSHCAASKTLYDDIIRLCKHNKVVAIGETGLDYFYDTVDRRVQIESFKIHIEAANALDLPVIVHARDAEEDILDGIKQAKKGVLHCFTGSYDMAKRAIDMGFFISFSGILTFKKAESLSDVARKLPLDRLLVETDAPFLSPDPKRGIKRNEPAFVQYVGKKLAELKGLPIEDIQDITTQNCQNLFNLSST